MTNNNQLLVKELQKQYIEHRTLFHTAKTTSDEVQALAVMRKCLEELHALGINTWDL